MAEVAASRCLKCPTGGHGAEPALAEPLFQRGRMLSFLKVGPFRGILCSRARRKPGLLSFVFHL